MFIHIGTQLPPYLFTAIRQARMFNEDSRRCSIVVVCNRDAQDNMKVAEKNMMTSCCVDTVHCESLPRSVEHNQWINNSTLDSGFRNGFWRHASERFFYLQESMKALEIQNVIHLETDNMVYQDMAHIVDVLQQPSILNVAATFDNDTRVIPGIIYFKNQAGADLVARGLRDFANQGENDMQVLAKLNGISHLPIVCREYEKLNQNGLVSASGHQTTKASSYSNEIDRFGCIFDAAAIGQHLGGIDMRNVDSTSSSIGFVNESCLFDTSKMKFEWHRNLQGRNVPWCIYDESIYYPIANLHVHSKQLELFSV